MTDVGKSAPLAFQLVVSVAITRCAVAVVSPGTPGVTPSFAADVTIPNAEAVWHPGREQTASEEPPARGVVFTVYDGASFVEYSSSDLEPDRLARRQGLQRDSPALRQTLARAKFRIGPDSGKGNEWSGDDGERGLRSGFIEKDAVGCRAYDRHRRWRSLSVRELTPSHFFPAFGTQGMWCTGNWPWTLSNSNPPIETQRIRESKRCSWPALLIRMHPSAKWP